MEIGPEYFTSKPTTFRNSAGGDFEAVLTCSHSASLPNRHELRVYKVDDKIVYLSKLKGT